MGRPLRQDLLVGRKPENSNNENDQQKRPPTFRAIRFLVSVIVALTVLVLDNQSLGLQYYIKVGDSVDASYDYKEYHFEDESVAKNISWKGSFVVSPNHTNQTDFYENPIYWVDPNYGARHPWNKSLGMIVDPRPFRIQSPIAVREEHIWRAAASVASRNTQNKNNSSIDIPGNQILNKTYLESLVTDRDLVLCPGGDGEAPGIEGTDAHEQNNEHNVPFIRVNIEGEMRLVLASELLEDYSNNHNATNISSNANKSNSGEVVFARDRDSPFARLRKGLRASMAFNQELRRKQKRKEDNRKAREATNNSSAATARQLTEKNSSKILCLVYSAYLPQLDSHSNARAQAHTWGRRCDGFIVASNLTDHSIGAIDLPHLGDEAYQNMWQKIRTMWAYAYHHFLDDYDWFHICGDDVYMIVDNLRAYVDGPEIAALEHGEQDVIYKRIQSQTSQTSHVVFPRPLMLGIPMARNPKRREGERYPIWFPAGGPGYTLNKAALKLFGDKGLQTFMPDARDPREDLFLGSALYSEAVYVSDTRDPLERPRFGGSASSSVSYDGKRSPISPRVQKRIFGIEYALGTDSLSSQAISFHLKDDLALLKEKNATIADSIYRYHTYLYNLTGILCGGKR